MSLNEQEAACEAILFAAGEAVTLEDIARALTLDTFTTKQILRNISDKMQSQNRGVEIIEINGSYQMCTKQKYYDYIKILYQNPTKKPLTQPLVETLAIIAYKQPVTKTQIEEIRGVDATHAVNKLLEYGLVCEKGRSDQPGKALIFGTTDDFLKYYGFSSLDKLPALPEIKPDSETGQLSLNI